MEKTLVFDVSSEGLDPLRHRIIGITTKTLTSERIITERDEKKLLENFWAYIRRNQFEKIVGFNSSNFDVHMLIIRSVKHKVAFADLRGKLYDLRKAIFGDEHARGTLREFQELLELNFPESRYRKLHMSLLWEAPQLTELREFLLQDVKITWKLYEHVSEAGLI